MSVQRNKELCQLPLNVVSSSYADRLNIHVCGCAPVLYGSIDFPCTFVIWTSASRGKEKSDIVVVVVVVFFFLCAKTLTTINSNDYRLSSRLQSMSVALVDNLFANKFATQYCEQQVPKCVVWVLGTSSSSSPFTKKCNPL